MVSDIGDTVAKINEANVLILVLMEYGLWRKLAGANGFEPLVS